MESRVITSSPLKSTWLTHAIIALLAASAFTLAPHAEAGVFLSVNIAPPLLPVYEQPPLPGPGYLWTPGYWAYAGGGYYWVPGTWVRAPYAGALWTPGYWGWGGGGAYLFHGGYWGRHVGYYGGINYGYGYTGAGYYGGYWNRGGFYYNRAANRFGGVRITNVYNTTVINNAGANRYSFNGPGGVIRSASRQELVFSHERHMGPIYAQVQQRTLASRSESLRASVNHGTPPIAATPRAGEFTQKGAASASIAHAPIAVNRAQAARHDVATKSGRGSDVNRASMQNGSVAHHGQPARAMANDRTARASHEHPVHPANHDQRMQSQHPVAATHVDRTRQNPGMRVQAPRQAPVQRPEPRQDRGNKQNDHKHGN